MKNRNKNWFWVLALTIVVFGLSGIAAFYSIFGLSSLFYAAGLSITLLATVLEIAKLITVSYVYRFWKIIGAFKWFYTICIIGIMSLTSAGVYGYLTGSFQKTANKVEMRDSQIKIDENKKALFVGQLDRINKSIESDNNRINQLSNIRSGQERRLDTLYNRRQNVKDERKSITGADEQIKFLNEDITTKMKQNSSVNDSISYYDVKIMELKNSDVSNEIGSYKFISDLTGLSINKVVNIVTLIIIVVCDPLAIGLLIGLNKLTMIKPEDEVIQEEKKHPILDKFKKFFSKKKIDSSVTSNITEQPQDNIKSDDLPVDIKPEVQKEIEKPEIIQKEFEIKPNNIQQKIQFGEDEPVNDTVNDTVIEKKTLVGEDFLENPEENEDEYEERLEPISFIEPNVLVYHEVFGKGKILDVYPNQRIKVEFESGEIKELNTDFAKLQQIKKDWFDNYAENLKKSEVDNLYVQEKIIDGKSILEFTTNDVEHEDGEIPYINIKLTESEPIII